MKRGVVPFKQPSSLPKRRLRDSICLVIGKSAQPPLGGLRRLRCSRGAVASLRVQASDAHHFRYALRAGIDTIKIFVAGEREPYRARRGTAAAVQCEEAASRSTYAGGLEEVGRCELCAAPQRRDDVRHDALVL